jgi:putative two-component system response regulator
MGSTYSSQLEDLICSTRLPTSAEAKAALSHLQGEIKYRLAKGSAATDFFNEVAEKLARIRGTAHAGSRMECLYDCAQFFYYAEQSAGAMNCLRALESLASRVKDSSWARKANQFLGIVHADSGDIAAAVPHYCTAFALARTLRDPMAETAVLINLGIALNYAGLYREAMPCFQRADVNASSIASVGFLRSPTLTNLAQSHLALGEHEEALSVIKQALAASDEPTDAVGASNRAVREFTFVQIALELGRLKLARERAEQCQHYARLGGMARGQFLAEVSIALCEIYGGNTNAGIKALEQSLLRCGQTANKEVALTALVKAYDQAEQPDKSLEYLRALLNHVRATRESAITALLSIPAAMARTDHFTTEEHDLRTLRYKEAQLRAKVAERDVLNSQIEMLERFAVTADLRDEISGEHGHRVGRLSALLAADFGLNKDVVAAIELGARLHDIGKIGVPDRILLNSNELRDVERHFISAHTAIGAELVGKSKIHHVRVAEEIARYHHEWWNGEGYPARLAANKIPIHARIVAIADVFDALTHGRPYSMPWSLDEALAQISSGSGTQFDPNLATMFLNLIGRLRAEHGDLDEFLSRGASGSPFSQARSRIRQLLSEELRNSDADSERKRAH